MVTEWHRMVIEWSLKCTCHSVDFPNLNYVVMYAFDSGQSFQRLVLSALEFLWCCVDSKWHAEPAEPAKRTVEFRNEGALIIKTIMPKSIVGVKGTETFCIA